MNGESSSELINVSIDKVHQSQQSNIEETKNLLKKNTRNELLAKRLIILSATLSFLITSLSLVLILIVVRHFNNNNNSTLLIREAINQDEMAIGYKASNFMLENLNQSVDPCFNFYEFTCGNWISRKEEETDQFTMAIERSLADLADILNEPIESNDSSTVQNLKTYFKSCINQTDIELNSDIQFMTYMMKKFTIWPMIQPINDYQKIHHTSLFDIEDYLAKLVSFRMPLVFRFESIEHDNRMIMKLTGTEDFCIMQKYLPKNNQTKFEFKKLIKQIVIYLSESLKFTLNEHEFDEQFEDMLKLVSELYFLNEKTYSCSAARSRPYILYFNTYELNENFTQQDNEKLFDFDKFINLLNDVSLTKFNKSNKILISSTALKYLKDLFNALKNNLNMNKQRFHTAFLNFIYFHTLFVLLKPVELFSIPHLHITFPMRYYQAFFEYDKMLHSKYLPLENFKSVYRLSIQQNCANSVIDSFSFANSLEQIELQKFFVSKKFDSNIKKETNLILKNLMQAAIELINDQIWIDSNVKKRIENKLVSLETYIGYSDSIDDGTAFIRNNKTIRYNLTSNYVFNFFKMREKQFEIEFDAVEANDSMRKKSDFDMFLSTPLFLKELNTLVFPAIVLMEPIFNLNNPIYLNYATVGVYLAHELWHSIEDEMLQIHKLFEGLECLNQNYKIYLNETNEDPNSSDTTLEEQIADNFGILVALKAYLKFTQMNEITQNNNITKFNNHLLPGLSYSREELFFIRYSISYCRKLKVNKNRIENFHVAHDYRAFQTSLLPEFVKYFQCSAQNRYLLSQCNIFEFKL